MRLGSAWRRPERGASPDSTPPSPLAAGPRKAGDRKARPTARALRLASLAALALLVALTLLARSSGAEFSLSASRPGRDDRAPLAAAEGRGARSAHAATGGVGADPVEARGGARAVGDSSGGFVGFGASAGEAGEPGRGASRRRRSASYSPPGAGGVSDAASRRCVRSGVCEDASLSCSGPHAGESGPGLSLTVCELASVTSPPARAAAIREAARDSFEAYRLCAWGADNLHPLSCDGSQWFDVSLGAVDALSTLGVMGLRDEFLDAAELAARPRPLANDGKTNVFEATIRAVGGLLSAAQIASAMLAQDAREAAAARGNATGAASGAAAVSRPRAEPGAAGRGLLGVDAATASELASALEVATMSSLGTATSSLLRTLNEVRYDSPFALEGPGGRNASEGLERADEDVAPEGAEPRIAAEYESIFAPAAEAGAEDVASSGATAAAAEDGAQATGAGDLGGETASDATLPATTVAVDAAHSAAAVTIGAIPPKGTVEAGAAALGGTGDVSGSNALALDASENASLSAASRRLRDASEASFEPRGASAASGSVRPAGRRPVPADLPRRLVARAGSLAAVLQSAFDTPTGLPLSDVTLCSGRASAPGWTVASSLSEMGSLGLEFTSLARAAGRPAWEALVEGIPLSETLAELGRAHGGLVPDMIDPIKGRATSRHVTLGSRADSYYEYLLKQWILLGGARGLEADEEGGAADANGPVSGADEARPRSGGATHAPARSALDGEGTVASEDAGSETGASEGVGAGAETRARAGTSEGVGVGAASETGASEGVGAGAETRARAGTSSSPTPAALPATRGLLASLLRTSAAAAAENRALASPSSGPPASPAAEAFSPEGLRDAYVAAVRGVRRRLLRRNRPGGLWYVGEMERAAFKLKVDHLTCFFPGLLALGAHHGVDTRIAADVPPEALARVRAGEPAAAVGDALPAPQRDALEELAGAVDVSEQRQSGSFAALTMPDLTLAGELARSCYEAYRSTSTGLAPELWTMLAYTESHEEEDETTESPTSPDGVAAASPRSLLENAGVSSAGDLQADFASLLRDAEAATGAPLDRRLLEAPGVGASDRAGGGRGATGGAAVEAGAETRSRAADGAAASSAIANDRTKTLAEAVAASEEARLQAADARAEAARQKAEDAYAAEIERGSATALSEAARQGSEDARAEAAERNYADARAEGAKRSAAFAQRMRSQMRAKAAGAAQASASRAAPQRPFAGRSTGMRARGPSRWSPGMAAAEGHGELTIAPMDGHSLLRPETAESFYLLWKTTGDERYREWSWTLFRAAYRHARVALDGSPGCRDRVLPRGNAQRGGTWGARGLLEDALAETSGAGGGSHATVAHKLMGAEKETAEAQQAQAGQAAEDAGEAPAASGSQSSSPSSSSSSGVPESFTANLDGISVKTEVGPDGKRVFVFEMPTSGGLGAAQGAGSAAGGLVSDGGEDVASGAGGLVSDGGEDVASGAGGLVSDGGEDVASGAGGLVSDGGEDVASGAATPGDASSASSESPTPLAASSSAAAPPLSQGLATALANAVVSRLRGSEADPGSAGGAAFRLASDPVGLEAPVSPGRGLRGDHVDVACRPARTLFASLEDVRAIPSPRRDSTESFWLAETLKYLWLAQADAPSPRAPLARGPPGREILDLDRVVLNTEAHPLRVVGPKEDSIAEQFLEADPAWFVPRDICPKVG